MWEACLCMWGRSGNENVYRVLVEHTRKTGDLGRLRNRQEEIKRKQSKFYLKTGHQPHNGEKGLALLFL